MPNEFPSDKHERLDVLSGTWDTSIEMLKRDGTPTGELGKATDTYSWSANGHFLVHEVDARMGGRNIRSLEIIAVDKDGDHYVTRSYDADGSINDFLMELNSDQLRITGRLQRFWGSFADSHQTLMGRWQYRRDEMSEWLPLVGVVLTRRTGTS
jgi:hypothetical protein